MGGPRDVQMERSTDEWTTGRADGQVNRRTKELWDARIAIQTHSLTDGQAEGWTDKPNRSDKETDERRDRHTNRLTGRRTNGRTELRKDKGTDGQTDRRTDG